MSWFHCIATYSSNSATTTVTTVLNTESTTVLYEIVLDVPTFGIQNIIFATTICKNAQRQHPAHHFELLPPTILGTSALNACARTLGHHRWGTCRSGDAAQCVARWQARSPTESGGVEEQAAGQRAPQQLVQTRTALQRTCLALLLPLAASQTKAAQTPTFRST